MSDRIRLSGLTVRGYHGVFAHERREGQDFTIDVVLHVDTRAAAATDDLKRTVHYGELAIAVAEAVRRDPVDLIETLAERIARVASEPELVEAVDVVVHKPHAPIPEDFADVAVEISRTRLELHGVPAVLALGTNLGDREDTLRSAVRALHRTAGIEVTAVSPVVETDPVGGPEQPDYLNAVVLVRTTLEPEALLAAAHAVEAAHDRVREVRWGPRTLDVDVVDYAGTTSHSETLDLPHPRAAGRAFVLVPWLAADPEARLPHEGELVAVAELLGSAPDRAGVRPRPDVLLEAG